MESVLVSIIIPVYNVEKYLNQCVDSAVNQTYKNLEIWLVNDGSKDSSGRICDEYKSVDSRIRVIHKENGGLSSARNVALDLMKGEYVYFLDSDDLISLDLIETYLNLIHEYKVDVVMGTSYEFYGNIDTNVNHIKQESKPEIYSKVEALKLMLLDEKLHHAAAGPLFKSDLYNDIRFPVGMLYEDYATTYYVMSKSKRVLYIDDYRCYYRMRPGSIMNSKVTERDMILLDIADTISHDIVREYPELENQAIRKMVVVNLKFYSKILDTGFGAFKNEQKRIRETLARYEKKFLTSGYAKKTDKVKIKAFKVGKIPFYVVYKISDYLQLIKKSLA